MRKSVREREKIWKRSKKRMVGIRIKRIGEESVNIGKGVMEKEKMEIDGWERIEIERSEEGIGYLGKDEILRVEKEVEILKVVKGKCKLRGMELKYIVENEGIVLIRFIMGMKMIVG